MRPFAPKRSWLCLQLTLLVLLAVPAQAVILLTGDNSANQTAPDAARTDIFNSVARVCNGSGGGAFGSAVHIRGKYMLTANHVNVVDGSHVTFDGVTLYERDTAFTPVQIAANVDIKLFKLVQDPGVNALEILDDALADLLVTATIVGVGVGRNPADVDMDTVWDWGSTATMAKRWGENLVEGTIPVSYQAGNYTALFTTLQVVPGNNEAAVTIYDSGCGLFVEHEGTWKLAGIATAVQTSGSSTFDDLSGDDNYFVRISSYAAAIEAAIPDLTTYAGWKTDHSLSGASANDDADDDADGIPLLVEFALGGDPAAVNLDVLPTMQMTEDSGSTYLELEVTRPIGLSGITYVPQTNVGLSAWLTDSTGILNDSPTPASNGDGTESLIYRRTEAISAQDHAFIRLRVETN